MKSDRNMAKVWWFLGANVGITNGFKSMIKRAGGQAGGQAVIFFEPIFLVTSSVYSCSVESILRSKFVP